MSQDKVKVLVVFGLDMNGDIIGADTSANLRVASAICGTNHFDYIIFTGGIFAPNQTKPVAERMSECWTRDHQGLESPVILTEANSLITRQNVINVVELLAQKGLQLSQIEITIVSEFWHTIGIWTLFFRLCGKSVKIASSDYCLPIWGIPGRFARIIFYLWDPKGTGKLTLRVIRERSQKL